MHTNSLVVLGATALVLVGCAVEVDGGASTGEDDVAASAESLYGAFSTSSCTSIQIGTLVESHRVGKLIAMTNEFDACLRSRVMYDYMPCYRNGWDPFATSSPSTQYTKARNIMRSGNTAPTDVECNDLEDQSGRADYGDYDQNSESVEVDDDFLGGKLASGGLDTWERADVAGLIWHEAMHQQGYRHSEDDRPDDNHCGYPLSEYSRGVNSIPYVAGRCMQSAGIHGRVMAWNADGTAQQLGAGWHRGSLKQLATVGDNRIRKMRLPPASKVRYCTDEGPFGTGTTSCRTERNDTIEYAPNHEVPSSYRDAISFVEVEPTALVFNARDYGGTVQALEYGEHRASAGALSVVGNDAIRSVYVPAGVRVRLCQSDGGTGGHGSGTCSIYESPQPVLGALEGMISYVEVVRVVSAFAEADLYGARDSYDVGVYHGVLGGLGTPGDNNIVSIVVPQGLTARICTDIGSTGSGTGFCETFTRTTFGLALGVGNAVSFMEVTPNTTGAYRLNVVRTGVFGSRVVSMPTGIDCPGDCSGDFLARSEVRLRGLPPANSSVVWSGCDRRSGNDCYVTMTGARSVSANFPALDDDCYDDCLALCELSASQCITECRATCMSP